MTDTSKRETLTLLGTAVAGAMMTGAAGAQNASSTRPEVRSSLTSGREPKPLPFDPAKLNGLSEKLIRSHWENNYIGSIKTLNMVAGRLLAAMNEPDLPPVIYGGLKREELHRLGSVVLHEQYFGNLGGDGKPGGDILSAVKKAYGSYEACRSPAARVGAC
jgi:superoxide dismutase, Fe-Mn family